MSDMHLGNHYLLELSGVDVNLLNDAKNLEQICLRFCSHAQVQVLHTHFHRFSPQGVTGLILIAESHLSIHTWPEHGYCAIDFFTCRVEAANQDPTEFFEKSLRPSACKSSMIQRSSHSPLRRRRA